MPRVLSTILLSCFLFATPLFAGGSTYSRFGIGDLPFFGGSRIYALGGTGIALVSDGFINRLNPAAMAKISLTRFSGGFEYTSLSSQSDAEKSQNARGGFQGLAFAVPISKENGVVLSFESTPYSLVHYAISRADSEAGFNSNQTYYGSGGLSSLALGLSFSVSEKFYGGAKFRYVYGRTRQLARVDFQDPTFTDYDIDRSQYYSGFNLTIGSVYEGLGDLLNAPSLNPLTVGVVLTLPTKLDVEDEVLYAATDTTITRHGTADFPLAFGVGLSYLLANRYQFVGDLSLQNWASANYLGNHPQELRNSTRVSFGVEVMPQRDADSYFQRVAYRTGFYYHSTYLQVNGQPIDEYFLTGGLGLPIGSDTRLNIGLQAGIRGAILNGLQKDTIFRLSFSISASEMWFMKFEED